MEKLPSKIVKFVSGSRLYGTNISTSDYDYFSVIKYPLDSIILGQDKGNIVNHTKEKDTAEKELRVFLKELGQGQSIPIEALFVKNLISTSQIWNDIVCNKEKFIGDLKPIISYATKQARNYTDKGSRVNSIKAALAYYKDKKQTNKIGDYPVYLDNYFQISGEFYICNSQKFYLNVLIKNLVEGLNIQLERFGQRALDASKDFDRKAYLHALRLCYEYIDLCEKGELVFPLANAQHLVKVRMGEISLSRVEEELSDLFDKVNSLSYNSKLDINFVEEFILDAYKKH